LREKAGLYSATFEVLTEQKEIEGAKFKSNCMPYRGDAREDGNRSKSRVKSHRVKIITEIPQFRVNF